MSNTTWMTITAKFESECALCGEHVHVGDKINWERGLRSVHQGCGHPLPYKKREASVAVAERPSNGLPAFAEIANGTYTVVHNTTTGEYVTLEVSEWKKAPGKQVLSYLNGPDNSTDFMGFAFFTREHGVAPWRRFKSADGSLHADMVKYVVAVAVILDIDKQHAAGEAYAMKSGRCCRCQRKLTVPASLHRGMGPVCAAGGTDAD